MEQKRTETGNSNPMKLIFNYEDIFYSFYYDDLKAWPDGLKKAGK